METINKLLNLYFAGETTIEQERELKNYFASTNVAAEHKAYIQLFETFAAEKSEKYPTHLPKIKTQFIHKKQFIISIISTAAAASVLLLLTIFMPKTEENYIVINGIRIDDSQLALQTARSKIIEISEIIETRMKPVKNINKINESLKPLQKLEDLNKTIQHTFDKLNFKL
ncbi:MAG: hypothetical protein LBT27_02995 [Prevotellaceae bacterium]|jgi:AraC-like DNA-binding protein|nr:hypothetical protein [Prevotellaceae bacterium]